MKRSLLYTLLIALLTLIVGCSKDVAEPAVSEPEEDEVVEETVEEETFEANYPLTGIETNEDINRRTVAVMVNNHPKARPQSGLHKSDIVYEVLAEGDVTRFLAIFQSQVPKKIGPVRSSRDYYITLSKGYDAFYIAHGFSPDAKEMLDAKVVDNINGMEYDGTLFERADFRKAPHNSYITYDNIVKGAEMNDIATTHDVNPLPFLTEDELAGIEGKDGKSIKIAYSSKNYATAEYMYDEVEQTYYRYSMGVITEDLDTKEPVSIDNLFIVETTHKVIDDAGRNDIDLTSGGKAYLLQKGKMKEVEWKNDDGRILPYVNGEAVKLVPGRTWINIVPTLSKVSQPTTN
ncbi:DUF3048 domain-containing protein [Bacillus suaedaesalsae]|uniref:DUF3048 domain-containing protein n=1 Tax=Bacillus suaedaesalsae TaxID=2810349 RepID=A0ABS2DCT0_9BACI|nr:DUF3048 domain-containing protein [Bacillus suaedaesalsae]MBM6616248.1 DUF3048 domain-containing protein [Bacillus suaedaesalsae]